MEKYPSSGVVSGGASEEYYVPKQVNATAQRVFATAGQTSMLARVLREEKLPIAIRLRKDFSFNKSSVELKNGEMLLLCFVVNIQMVQATLDRNTSYNIPIYGKQLYERLPWDPALDNKIYKGTKSLIEAKPLPQEVRVLDAMFSDEWNACQVSGEVIQVLKVDTQINKDKGKEEKVLVGMDEQRNEVRFSEDMDMSTYTTQICPDLLPMSELVKFGMPQRVRLHESNSTKSNGKKNNVTKEMKLQQFVKEYRVIAARSTDNMLLSIPISSKMDLYVVDATLRGVAPLLPAIFNRTNVTLGVTDVTQYTLPNKFSAVPQPLPGIIETWISSYEGDKLVCKAHNESVETLQRVVKKKEKENAELKKNLARFQAQVPKPLIPKRGVQPGAQAVHTWHSCFNLADTTSVSPSLSRDEREEGLGHEYMTAADAELPNTRFNHPKNKPTSTGSVERRIQGDAIYETIPFDTEDAIYITPEPEAEIMKQTTCEGVLDFLKENDMSEYCDKFEKEKINGTILFELSTAMLIEDLGMRKLDATKLMVKIQAKKDKYADMQALSCLPEVFYHGI